MNEIERCRSQEWHSDGRGLWAMRACVRDASHGGHHEFGPWRYKVSFPGETALEESAKLRAALEQIAGYTFPVYDGRVPVENAMHVRQVARDALAAHGQPHEGPATP